MRRSFVLIILSLSMPAFGQIGRKITREEYIETYKELAMREMERVKIPASITLAQGILESGNGNSTLARKANNHFGIKCHDWKGKSIRHDDDEKNECFRRYKSVEQSYYDHSEFLTTRGRYSALFELAPDDYKGWAKGLKKAGYATSPHYADALIKLIEDYNLHQYDVIVIAKTGGKSTSKSHFDQTEYAGGRKIHYNNRVKYVLARQGDGFYNLSEELDLFQWQLPKYNDLDENTVFNEGDRVYLQPKRNRAEMGRKIHVVQEGESLQSISQLYAIKLEKLAKRNHLTEDAKLKPGEEILLRGRKKGLNPNREAPSIELKEEQEEQNTDQQEFRIEFDADK